MKKRKITTTASSNSSSGGINRYLPEDLIADIQRRLKPSCIPRIRCVSKSWNSVLSNPKSVYKNLFYYGENELDTDTQILIADSKYNPSEYNCRSHDSLLPLVNAQSLRKFPNNRHDLRDCRLWIGSCEGGFVCLVYVQNYGTECFYSMGVGLFNPATDETKMLPPLPAANNSTKYITDGVSVGFGLVKHQYHYKVVTICRCRGLGGDVNSKVHVFSSEHDSQGWKKLRSLDSELKLREKEIPQYGCTRKKKCYWIAENVKWFVFYVVSFDLSTEKFQATAVLTNRAISTASNVYMVKEETLVVIDSAVEVWVLQRSGVGESWCKLFLIDFPGRTRMGLGLKSRWSVVGLLKHGHVVYMVHGGTSLQIVDVTTGQTSSVPFKAPDLHLGEPAIHHLTTYVPSKMSLSDTQSESRPDWEATKGGSCGRGSHGWEKGESLLYSIDFVGFNRRYSTKS
ncbi:Probable F-box protein At5g47300 [Linum grandiflorum]